MDLIERLNWLLAEYQAGRNPLSENATCSLLWEVKSELEKRDAELARFRSERRLPPEQEYTWESAREGW